MTRLRLLACGAAVAAALIGAAGFPSSAGAAKRACISKTADGTGASVQTAKFQAYEGLLQATDWGAWAAWMADGTTPGYKVNTVKYNCTKGTGLGATCRGHTTICKL